MNKTIADLEMVNRLNADGCAACGRKFNLGDPVVMACGAWEGSPRWIHESEAVFDRETNGWIERRCFDAKRGVIG